MIWWFCITPNTKMREGKRRERIEPTHIKSNLFISYGSRKCMQGRNPVKQYWRRMQRRSSIYSTTDQHEPDVFKAPPWILLDFNKLKWSTALVDLLRYSHLSPNPTEQRFVLSLTTFSISSRSHCDVSLTISDSWKTFKNLTSQNWFKALQFLPLSPGWNVNLQVNACL